MDWILCMWFWRSIFMLHFSFDTLVEFFIQCFQLIWLNWDDCKKRRISLPCIYILQLSICHHPKNYNTLQKYNRSWDLSRVVSMRWDLATFKTSKAGFILYPIEMTRLTKKLTSEKKTNGCKQKCMLWICAS